MKRKKRRVWKAVGLLAIAAAFFILTREIKPYVVLSGSMEPVIPVGSVVLTDQSRTAVSAGDIAAFRKWPDSDTSHHQRGRRRIYHKRGCQPGGRYRGNGSGKHHWYGCVLHSLSWLRDYVAAGIQVPGDRGGCTSSLSDLAFLGCPGI